MIKIGYACINTLLPSSARTFRLANYSEKRMLEVSRENISALRAILEWNRDQGISLFRITSNLIPFVSSTINSGVWQRELADEFREIGSFIRANKMRVSMHPGQYTVLNTPNPDFYENSLRDLYYHNRILELMELPPEHIIIIHGGGAYKDKEKSLHVLEKRISSLPREIRKRLALENDEHIFTAEDIYNVCIRTSISGVLDVYHHSLNPGFQGMSDLEVILLYKGTWKNCRQKIHYSDQEPSKPSGTHSTSVNLTIFDRFYKTIRDLDLDIMLEVKDKQESLLKIRKRYREIR